MLSRTILTHIWQNERSFYDFYSNQQTPTQICKIKPPMRKMFSSVSESIFRLNSLYDARRWSESLTLNCQSATGVVQVQSSSSGSWWKMIARSAQTGLFKAELLRIFAPIEPKGSRSQIYNFAKITNLFLTLVFVNFIKSMWCHVEFPYRFL